MGKPIGIVVVVLIAAAMVTTSCSGSKSNTESIKPDSSDKYVGTWKVTRESVMGLDLDPDGTIVITRDGDQTYKVERTVEHSLPPGQAAGLVNTYKVDGKRLSCLFKDTGDTSYIRVDGNELVEDGPKAKLTAKRLQ